MEEYEGERKGSRECAAVRTDLEQRLFLEQAVHADEVLKLEQKLKGVEEEQERQRRVYAGMLKEAEDNAKVLRNELEVAQHDIEQFLCRGKEEEEKSQGLEQRIVELKAQLYDFMTKGK